MDQLEPAEAVILAVAHVAHLQAGWPLILSWSLTICACGHLDVDGLGNFALML